MKWQAALPPVICAAIFTGAVIHGGGQLPERVATHFDGQGVPDRWTGKSGFVLISMLGGLGLPALMTALLYGVRFLPARLLNVPRATYWRDPINYPRACGILFNYSLWAASAFLLWQAALVSLIVNANQTVPPRLDSASIMLATVALLAFTGGWTIALIRRFFKTPG